MRSTRGSGRGDCVERVRVVQHGGLGRPGRPRVVVHGDAMQELGLLDRGQPLSPLVDEPNPELDVPQQVSLVRHRETGPGAELEHTADVVDERRREQQIGAQARVELRRLATDRRDADGVLEQAARVGVVSVGRRGACRRAARPRAPREPSPRDRRARPRRRGTPESRPARRCRAVQPESATQDRRRKPRASGCRAAGGHESARRARAPARRHLRRSDRRAAPRRSRHVRRSFPSDRRAPAPDRPRHRGCAACASP